MHFPLATHIFADFAVNVLNRFASLYYVQHGFIDSIVFFQFSLFFSFGECCWFFLVMYSHFSMHTTTVFCLHVHDRFFTFVCNLLTMKICVRLHSFL